MGASHALAISICGETLMQDKRYFLQREGRRRARDVYDAEEKLHPFANMNDACNCSAWLQFAANFAI